MIAELSRASLVVVESIVINAYTVEEKYHGLACFIKQLLNQWVGPAESLSHLRYHKFVNC